jgi:phosphoglycolate phosphatase-like HAD superfamily hydrolase
VSSPLPELPNQAAVLISFDIDGTLEDGDPPGPIPMELAEQALSLGYLVGSASDRTVREQEAMWSRRGLEVHFVGHKHHLDRVASRFTAERMVHVGDTDVDEHFARLAGFEFHYAGLLPPAGTAGWIF